MRDAAGSQRRGGRRPVDGVRHDQPARRGRECVSVSGPE